MNLVGFLGHEVDDSGDELLLIFEVLLWDVDVILLCY
jgi:hypothetical protein